MHEDLISELYKRQASEPEMQDRARRRIDWLRRQARGETVLDIGCSQGILTVLLARDGFDAVGIDARSSAIAYAESDLAREPVELLTGRARFLVADATDLPWSDGVFDSVVVGDLLHEVVAPERVLTEAARVLRTDGRLALTVPFGLAVAGQRQVFFARELTEIVSEHFVIQTADVRRGAFRIVAQKGTGGEVVRTIRDLDQAVNAAVVALQERSMEAEAQWRGEREDLTRHIIQKQTELNVALHTRARQQQDARVQLERLRSRIADLEVERAEFRYARDVADWRYRSVLARRWWRLGVAVGQLRRHPLRLWRVLKEVRRVLFGPSPQVPRPEKPRLLAGVPRPGDEEVIAPPRVVLGDPSSVPGRLLVVATALGEDEEQGLSLEWVSQPVTPENWSTVLRDSAPELLLMSDSYWSRIDEPAAAGAPAREMLRAFRAAGVVTVFWDGRRRHESRGREEVPHLFDHVACSFEETAEGYRAAVPPDRVHLFAPAVQTRAFSPLRAGGGDEAEKLLLLGAPGSSVSRWVEDATRRGARMAETDVILEKAPAPSEAAWVARASGHQVVVCEASSEPDDREIRRLLAVAATKTPLVVAGVMPDELSGAAISAENDRDLVGVLRTLLTSTELREQHGQQSWRHVRRDRSLAVHLDRLLERLDIAPTPAPPSLSFMIPTNRPHHLETILDNLGRQTYPDLSVVLVLHGVELDRGMVKGMADERGIREIEVVSVPEYVALGEVFNRGFSACRGELVGKMDDDDHYGAEYASDLVSAFDHTSAEIVGKWSHYAYMESLDATFLRFQGNEHSYQTLLAISTLIMRRRVLDEVTFPPMPRGSGSQFLREAGALGARIYAGDRYNYLYNRYASGGHQHTWAVADYEFAAKAQYVCQGRNLAVVDA